MGDDLEGQKKEIIYKTNYQTFYKLKNDFLNELENKEKENKEILNTLNIDQ